jgi:hypothetical protein
MRFAIRDIKISLSPDFCRTARINRSEQPSSGLSSLNKLTPLSGLELQPLFHPHRSEFRTKQLRAAIKQWPTLNTSHWQTVCAGTLTLKQGQLDDIEIQYKKAFRRFMNKLNRTAFKGHARYRDKRLSVIPILEKSEHGRWHYHIAVEPPEHMSREEFTAAVCWCWWKTHWGHRIVDLKFNSNPPWLHALQGKLYTLLGGVHASQGWVNYMLKPRGKSGLEAWFDCIDFGSLHNPID